MMVRKMFKVLEEEKENFGWNIRYAAPSPPPPPPPSTSPYSETICTTSLYRVGFADTANQDVASMLVAEVKPHLPDVPSVTIKGEWQPQLIICTL